MKGKLIALAMILTCIFAFASPPPPEVEDDSPVTLGIWGADRPLQAGNPDSLMFWKDYVLEGMDVDIVFYAAGESGAAQPIDLDIAAGVQPDIYHDYLGRVSKYANSRYAVELTEILDQSVFDQYIPSFLELMQKDGGQYGLPGDAWLSTMIVNQTLLERVGMGDVLDDQQWTIDEFLEASRRVKALGEDYYGYHLFSASTGGDYWFLGFLSGFGANLYTNGRIGINTPEGRSALAFYRDFAAEGLSPPGPAATPFQDFLASWQTGKILAFANNPSAAGPDTGIASYEAGNAEEPFISVVSAFPTAPGIESAPICLGPDGAMIFNKGGTPRQAVIDAFLALTGERSQRWRTKQDGRWSSLFALAGSRPNDPNWLAGNQVLLDNGVWDMGVGLQAYGDVRVLVPPLFQAIYTGELTVEEAVARFESDGNAALEAAN